MHTIFVFVTALTLGAAPPDGGVAGGTVPVDEAPDADLGLGEVEPGTTVASLDPYWFVCAAVADGAGVLTNGSPAMVGQTASGRIASASYTIDVGLAPCISGTGSAPPDEGPDLVLWMSFQSPTVVPGLGTVEGADIVAYDTVSHTWSMVFDGSDVGLGYAVIDGMARESDGDILLSFTSFMSLARYFVDDSDIVRFTPTSLGANTAGWFTFLMDASDVGLSTDAEDVDGIDVAEDGRVVLSTNGAFVASGASGGGEDLIVFNAFSFGTATFGSFDLYFDGSDVGLTTIDENIDAVAHTADGSMVFSTDGLFVVTGASGDDEDVLEFVPGALGDTTTGSYTLLLDLSSLGISTSADIGSLEVLLHEGCQATRQLDARGVQPDVAS